MQVISKEPDASAVRQELNLILGSAVFRGSKRCQDFLRFVATKSLEGAAGTLKERTLATEVFGRDSSADLGEDSIVRVGAREVRKRLAQYYVTDGAHDPVRIDLPAGSYVPSFHYYSEKSERALETAVSTLPERQALANEVQRVGRGQRRWAWAAACGALCLLLTAAVLWRTGAFRQPNGFDTFWAPVLQPSEQVVMVMPNPIVYYPSSRATALDAERNPASQLPNQRAIDLPPELLNGSDLIPVLDQFVGFGDAMAALRMTNLLARHSITPKYRLASKVEFTDLRDSTPILIGAFTNRWTTEITKTMRYHFAYDRQKPSIIDEQTTHAWTLTGKKDNGRTTEDYILICRLPHSRTGKFALMGAGLTVYGTEEAGRILTEPDALGPVLKKLPKNWANQNMEFVLHVEVVDDAPALPELVASQILP